MTEFSSEVAACYHGSDGERTKTLYERLKLIHPAGIVAVNLLRACKNSERAKGYKSRRSVGKAYGSKDWALGELVGALIAHADGLGIVWGWGRDEKTTAYENVLYVDVPDAGQVSFHLSYRGAGPDYRKQWDGIRGVSASRVIRYANAVLGINQPPLEENHERESIGKEGAAAAGSPKPEPATEERQASLDL